jgi:hypothetical protein
MNNSRINLNPDNFKRWINNHPDEQDTQSVDMVGVEVQAKYLAKKMMRNMCVESGKPGKVIKEFMEGGGIVETISGNEYLIKVKSGDFTINKKYVIT